MFVSPDRRDNDRHNPAFGRGFVEVVQKQGVFFELLSRLQECIPCFRFKNDNFAIDEQDTIDPHFLAWYREFKK